MGGQVRITYNYTKADFTYYNDKHEEEMLFGAFTDDDGETMPPFIQQGDAYATYDVSHWEMTDLMHFMSVETSERLGLLEGLTEITV